MRLRFWESRADRVNRRLNQYRRWCRRTMDDLIGEPEWRRNSALRQLMYEVDCEMLRTWARIAQEEER